MKGGGSELEKRKKRQGWHIRRKTVRSRSGSDSRFAGEKPDKSHSSVMDL